MPEPPGNGLYLSARGRRTRSTVRKYPPGWRPLTSEIGGVYCLRFRQVKGVGNYADESEQAEARVLPGERGTPMIRSGEVKIRAARCPSLTYHRGAPHPAPLLRLAVRNGALTEQDDYGVT
jgi:hypothetical protein